MTAFWRDQDLPLGLAATTPAVLSAENLAVRPELHVQKLVLLRPGTGGAANLWTALERTHLLQLDLTLDLQQLAHSLTGVLRRRPLQLDTPDGPAHVQIEQLDITAQNGQLNLALWLETPHTSGPITAVLAPSQMVTRPSRWELLLHDVIPWFASPVHPSRILQCALATVFGELGFAGHLPDFPGLVADPGWAVDGLTFSVDPVKTIALETLAPNGWKLPSCGDGLRSVIVLHEDRFVLRAWDADHELAEVQLPDDTISPAPVDLQALTRHAAVDRAFADGQTEHARELLLSARQYGLDPGLVWRLGHLLLHSDSDSALLETLCDDAAAQSPEDAGPLVLQALAHQRRGDLESAAATCRKALHKLPDDQKPQRVAGLVTAATLEANTSPQRAIAALREVIEIAPDARAAIELLDSLYADTAAHSSRKALLERRLSQSSGSLDRARVQLDRARLMHELESPAERDQALARAIALAPPRPELLADIAQTQQEFGDASGALATLLRAANAAAQTGDRLQAADLHLERARLLAHSPQRTGRAESECHTALTIYPDHRDTLLFLSARLLANQTTDVGTLAAHANRLERALESLRSTGTPDDELRQSIADVLRAQASALEKRGRSDEAADRYRRLIHYDTTDDQAYEWLRRHFERRGEPQEAIDIHLARIDALPDSDPRRRAAMLGLSDLYEALGLPGDALRWLEKATGSAPRDPELAQRMIDLLEALGDHYALRTTLLELADQSTRTSEKAAMIARAGELSLALDDPGEAARLLERAVALKPGERRWLQILRKAQLADGNLEGVVAVLERLARVTEDAASRRQYLVEAGDVLYDELERAQRAWGFYKRAQEIHDDPALARLMGRIERGSRSVPGDESPKTQTPGTGPPTDVGPALESEEEWTPSPTITTGELPEPISEELEVTLTARDTGRMGLELVGRESILDLPESTPTPASETPAAELPPFKPASLAPSDEDMVVASAQNDRASSEASGRWRTRMGQDGVADEVDEAHLLDPAELDGDATRPPFAVSGDQESASFQPPAADAAPDWRTAAREWTLQKDKKEPPDSPIDTPADQPAANQDPRESPVGMALRARLEDARRAGDPETLGELLEALVEEEDNRIRRARFHQELGLLAHHELEKPELARHHLEAALRDDSDGVGLEYETLSALEGIYEHYHEYEALLDVYNRKLQREESEDMAVVYRLLMAQLCLEQLGRPGDARVHIDAALETDPRNEAALKLLAEVEESAGHPDRAVQHLETLVELLPTGFERSEAMVTLAGLREDSGMFEAAHDAWQEAISSAADPMQVIDQMKSRCRERDDWRGLLNALLTEVSIQLEVEPTTLDALASYDMTQVPSHQRVSVRQTIREMADILAMKLDALSEAWELYGQVLQLSPEEPYALERRIELGRQLQLWQPLARELEQLSAMLLDPALQFEALSEAARLYRDHLGDANRARTLFAKAVGLYDSAPETRPGQYESARTELDQLSENVVQRVSLGNSSNWRMPTPPPQFLPGDEPHRRETLDPHERTDVKALLDKIESEQQEGPTLARRVELLSQKGSVLSRFPETQRDALISFRAALALEPNHVPARMALVDGLLANGEVEQALNHLIVLAQRTPPNRLDGDAKREIVSSVEVIVATGKQGVSERARALLESLKGEDT